MKFLVTKTCQGVMDTENERHRINEAFKNEPEIRKRLLLLMDAIEARQWKKRIECSKASGGEVVMRSMDVLVVNLSVARI